MTIDEIDSDYDVVVDLEAHPVEKEPLTLDQNNGIEKVDRFVRNKLQAMQDWCIEGMSALVTSSVWRFEGSVIGYVADKVARLVRGCFGPLVFLPLMARMAWGVASAGISLTQKLFFHTNDFFYYRGQLREFKDQLENFVHWNVDLYSHYTAVSGELPFAERTDQIIKVLKEKAPDMLFLSHVNGDSADRLFEGLKSEYIDFFLDVGSKGGWSINGGLFIASKVPLASPPRFYQLDLGKRFSYQGGFFVIETADQLFVVTDVIHGACPLVLDLRAKAITEIIHFLQLENEQNPIGKEIFIAGDMAFSSQLEVQNLRDSLLENDQVLIEERGGVLQISLDQERHNMCTLNKEGYTDVYASIHAVDTFTLIPIEHPPEEDEGVDEIPTEERRFEDQSEISEIYTYKERDHSGSGGGIDEHTPYEDKCFEAQGHLEPEEIIRDRLFSGVGGKDEEEKVIEEHLHAGTGAKPDEVLVAVEPHFEGKGEQEQQALDVTYTPFTGRGEKQEAELTAIERQFEGRGEEEVAVIGVVDTPHQSEGTRDETFEIEEIAFEATGTMQEEEKEVRERQFEGYGEEVTVKEEDVTTDDTSQDTLPTDEITDEVDEIDIADESQDVISDGALDEVDDTSVSDKDDKVVDESQDEVEQVDVEPEEPVVDEPEEEKPVFVDRIFR